MDNLRFIGFFFKNILPPPKYNGDVSVTDNEGRNAFYYAHCSQKYNCAEFLLRNGCPKQLIVNPTSRPPFSSPVHSHASIQSSQIDSISTMCCPSSLPITTTVMMMMPAHHFSHLQQHQGGLTSSLNQTSTNFVSTTNQTTTSQGILFIYLFDKF